MKLLLKVYIGITILLVVDTILYISNDISLPGHYSDWLLFWAWIILSVVVIAINIKKRWARIYSLAIIGFTIFTMIPMMIPFLSILFFAVNTDDTQYRLNDEITLQKYSRSIISNPKIVAVRSYGFYEKIIGATDFWFEVNENSYQVEDATSIRQLENNIENGDSLRIEFKFQDAIIVRTMQPQLY